MGRCAQFLKIISEDCSRQKCYITFQKQSQINDDLSPTVDYVIGKVTSTLLNSELTHSYTKETIKDVFPELTEIILHVSPIPTRSVLIFKTETFLDDEEAAKLPKPKGMTASEFRRRKLSYIDEKRYFSLVEVNGINPEVLQGKVKEI